MLRFETSSGIRVDQMTHAANEPLENWLAQETPETVLEPELPIIDSHHHLWDLRKVEMAPDWSFQQKVYFCEEITDEIQNGGHNVVQTVFAQCGAFYRADGPEEMRCVGETEFVHGIVAMSQSGLYGSTRLCAGIFGAADLRLGHAVEEVIKAHLDASPNFRGIRSPFPSDLNDQFLEGYAVLGKYGLSFDNYSPDFERLATLAKLATTNPEVPIIVNHLGGRIDPEADADTVARWQKSIDAIAECPNAVL